MREIWIPELLSSLFVVIFLVRPLFKGLWPLDGIAWLPLAALGITAAIFPAYGFRPECIPLLVHQGVLALGNMGPLLVGTRRHTGFHETGALVTVSALGLLIVFTAGALWFAPQDLPAAAPRLVRVNGRPAYTLHIFNGGDEGGKTAGAGDLSGARPLIFLVPPDFGGLKAVDSLCAALGGRGFTVISYTRKGAFSPGRPWRLWRAFRRGTVLKKANDTGRALEAGRKAEIEFLLPYVKENLETLAPGADGKALFLAGWGAGGSALAYLAAPDQPATPAQPRQPSAEPGPAARFPGALGREAAYGALGLVLVESRLWSSWAPAPPLAPAAKAQNPLLALLGTLRDWAGRLRPGRIAGPGIVRPPEIPVLYLVSDQALGKGRQNYAALFTGLRNSGGPAALAAIEGAGPLDYTDFPAEYPLYTTLFPGAGATAGAARRDYGAETAALIARFCELARGGAASGEAPPGQGELRQGELRQGGLRQGELRQETRYWNLGDLRLY
jgi:hypothetical protein